MATELSDIEYTLTWLTEKIVELDRLIKEQKALRLKPGMNHEQLKTMAGKIEHYAMLRRLLITERMEWEADLADSNEGALP